MKTIIAGSRNYLAKTAIYSILDRCPWKMTEVVCGEACGPDTIGKEWGEQNLIHVESFPAKWNELGKYAGPARNKEMAEYADAAIIFWDGTSRGTKNMIDLSISHGLHLLLVRVKISDTKN